MFLYWGALYVYSPILPVYAASLGASFTTVGVIVGAYGLVQMLLRIPVGIWSDRLGWRLPFLYAGHFFNLLGCLGLALAPNPAYLVLARGVFGISASTWVGFTVLYASYFPPDETPKAMGVVSAINGISLTVFIGLGGQIAEIWGMESTFYVGAILAILGIVTTSPVKEQRVTRRSLTVRQIRSVMTHPIVITTALISALNQYVIWATTFGFVPLYADGLGASKSALGIIGVIALLPYTLASLVNHRVASRLGENRALFVGILVMSAMAFVVPLINSLPLLAITQGISGVGRGMTYPLLMGLSIRQIPEQDRATAMGAFQATYAIGMFLGPMTSGAVADIFGLAGAFVVAGSISSVAALVALILLKPEASEANGA
jgi:MFS family permease